MNHKHMQHRILGTFIAGVWIFHGLYSKILNGIPRHKQITGEILGESVADTAIIVIGSLEILMGCWVLSGLYRKFNALTQTVTLISMNTLEIIFAKQYLLSAGGMVALNIGLLWLVWWWAIQKTQSPS